jgi:hypothetical protein
MKTKPKKSSAKSALKRRDPNRYPKGLNRRKALELIDYYENQTDEEAIAEDEAAYCSKHSTMMEIPNEFVWLVQKLISKGKRK